MIGDQSDFLRRLKAVMPNWWFPDVTPILDAVLTGCANAWAWNYQMLAFVKTQSRRLTASGVFLDMIASDFFGAFIRRRVNEPDAALSTRIGKELFREKGTRAGMIAALTDLTGNAPDIFEPANTFDTGGYNIARGYSIAGGYGSLLLSYQCFITVFRPHGQGVSNVAGYGTLGGFFGMPGGYGVGAIEYVTPSMFAPQISDQDILDVIEDVRPVATIAWTRISGMPAGSGPIWDAFAWDDGTVWAGEVTGSFTLDDPLHGLLDSGTDLLL